MDTTLVPPQLRVKTSFSIEHILSKPEKSSALDYTNRCNKSVEETVHNYHFSYSNSDSAASEQKISEHSNDGACATPDSSCVDACSDVASEESTCTLRLHGLCDFKYLILSTYLLLN